MKERAWNPARRDCLQSPAAGAKGAVAVWGAGPAEVLNLWPPRARAFLVVLEGVVGA
jgi:hypothetical protein